MTRQLIPFATVAALALAAPAEARECNGRAIDVILAPGTYETVVEHPCITADTVLVLVPVSQIGAVHFVWQEFPNAVYGRAWLNHGALGFERRLIGILKEVE